ncbi:hypothetical protein [Mycolicibacterium goodii]|uniref:hypothetical protein n=1 Tax=Mycolicibacterium goodii TaxID=134601 RepID=UPI00257E83CC|nr:hypothetical protein [Mycolicibacterium goodii]
MTSRDDARRRAGERSTPTKRRVPAAAHAPRRRSSTTATSRKVAGRRSRTPRPQAEPDLRTADSGEQGSGRGSVFERAIDWVKDQVRRLLTAVRDRSQALTAQLQEWMDKLFDAIENGGPRLKAAVEAIRAVLSGKNPVWAAIKGLWAGLSGAARALLLLAVIVAILLLPVLVIVLLLALLVVAVIVAVRAASD